MMENTGNNTKNVDSTGDCAICLERIQRKKTLKCQHSFCSECIDSVFSLKPACPICNTFHGVYTGTQPQGTMTVTQSILKLPGFENCGSIVIQYSFPAGIQGVSRCSCWYVAACLELVFIQQVAVFASLIAGEKSKGIRVNASV